MDQLANVNVARLYQLADFLETVPPEDFDLSAWQDHAPREALAIGPITFRRACGFAGCAMGWAAHSGLFEGLRINRDNNLVYKGASDIDAAAKVFGITVSVAEFIFYPLSYVGYDPIDPDDVARRVRKLAAKVEARVARRSGKAWLSMVAPNREEERVD